MTPDEANREIRRIKAIADSGDSEQAHAWEDQMYIKALRWIAENGDDKSARLARVVVSSADLAYERWYG